MLSSTPSSYTMTAHSYPSSTANPSTMTASTMPAKLKRIDTQDLKGKLLEALGANGKRYMASLLEFMTAKIDRNEFEEEALICLKPQHVHLHNALVLGLLYNASSNVPGPSTRGGAGLPHHRDAFGQLVDADGNVVARSLDDADDHLDVLQPASKRLRLLTAGLSRKERARIRNIPKQLAQARAAGGNAVSSLGWAGAGADMLEKKRKEEEKRRSVEEKQRAREAYTEIGAREWKGAALQAQKQVTSMHERLPANVQQEVARALAMPLCVESKQLPDLDSIRDLMTLQTVEAGFTNGVQPQAAALLLASLQCHLQNVMANVITKIRANRQVGIRVTGIHRTAVASSAADGFALITNEDGNQSLGETGSGDNSFETSGSAPSPTSHRLRAARRMLQDAPSASSSSLSLALAGSGADSSMMSLASTAPTSLPADSIASSEAASNNDHSQAVSRTRGGEGEEEQGDLTMSDGSQDIEVVKAVQGEATSNGPAEAASSNLELRHLSFLLDLAPHSVVESLGQGPQERLLASDWTHADEDAVQQHETSMEGMLQRQARQAATAKLNGVSATAIAAAGQVTATGQPLARNNFIIDQLAPVRLFDRRTLAESQATLTGRTPIPRKGGLRLPSGRPTAVKGPAASASAERASDASNEDSAPSQGQQTATQPNDGDATVSNGAANTVADLAAMIASRYGGSSAFATGQRSPAPTAMAQAAAAANASHHHHRAQDSHLYDVVDPVALLASLVT